ncbi:MAG: DNA-binding domain-containing protein [Marinobacterium sp.]|nr:DNA-binding domain-containing protein [Marinobacterium sp.]
MKLSKIQSRFSEAISRKDPSVLIQPPVELEFEPERSQAVYNTLDSDDGLQALKQSFPVINRLVGDDYFETLAGEYCRHYPAESDDILRFGDRFPLLLLKLSIERRELDKLRFLPELARLEWLIQMAYFADRDSTFDFDALASVPMQQQPQIIFTLSHALNLMFSDWPVFEIWRAHQHGAQTLPSASLSLDGGQEWLCIYRDAEQPVVETVPTEIASVLGEMMQGHCLGELACHCAEIDHYLPEMVRHGWLSGFYLDQAA